MIFKELEGCPPVASYWDALARYFLHHAMRGVDSLRTKPEVEDGIGSYAGFVRPCYYEEADAKSIVFPGILRYCDLPQLMEWLKQRGTVVK